MKKWIGAICLTAMTVSAQSNVYWNVTDGDLAVPANWSGGILPVETNTVVFGQQGAFTLTTSAWLTNYGALFNAGSGGGAVTLNLSGYGLSLTNTLTFKRQSGSGPYSLALTGGTLLTEKKVLIGDGNPYHTLRVSSAGTRWICATNREGFVVSGMSNRLEITDGAYFYSGSFSSLDGVDARGIISGPGTYACFLNPKSDQHGNDAVFTLRNNGGELRVTDQAVLYVKALNGNAKGLCVNNWWNQPISKRLILDGGAVITNLGVFAVDAGIEGQGSGNENSAVVSNATLYVDGQTWIGYGWNLNWSGSKVGGNNNTLSLGDGALVRLGGGDTFVGLNQMASMNLLDIYGTAFVTNTSSVRVGSFGSNNQMKIRDGAQYFGWIGVGATSYATNNLLTISGGGTRYVCATYSDRHVNDVFLYTGSSSSFNKAVIDDGARVELLFYNGINSERRGLVTGVYSNASANEIIIRGKSFVTNMGWMCIGNTHWVWGGGSGNRVVIDDATYFGATIYVGGGHNNVTVKEQGASTNNLFVVSGGAQVSVNSLVIGNATNSCSNRLVVDGRTTTLSTGGLYGNSSDNTISITNGTLAAGWINFGGYGNGYNARTRLEFNGTNSQVSTVSQSIIITNSTTLVFNIGAAGYAKVPFVSLYDLRVDGTTGLEINASEWARRKGGRLVLVQTGRTAYGSFTDWAARAVKDSNEYTVSAEGGLIVLTSPRKDATLISLF